LGDLDLDGSEDIIIGNAHAPNFVFLNRKNGEEWVKIKLSDEHFLTYDISVGDLNGDGRLDLLESNSDEYNIYYFNILNK
jgi:hypothetical protein